MFWDAVNWIHQRICIDPFTLRRHPETMVRRETGRLYVECLKCGHCSKGMFLRETEEQARSFQHATVIELRLS